MVGNELTDDQITMLIAELREEIVNLRTEFHLEQSNHITTQANLHRVMTYLDIEHWTPPMPSGNLSAEVINMRVELGDMERRFFGKNIDAMVDV